MGVSAAAIPDRARLPARADRAHMHRRLGRIVSVTALSITHPGLVARWHQGGRPDADRPPVIRFGPACRCFQSLRVADLFSRTASGNSDRRRRGLRAASLLWAPVGTTPRHRDLDIFMHAARPLNGSAVAGRHFPNCRDNGSTITAPKRLWIPNNIGRGNLTDGGRTCFARLWTLRYLRGSCLFSRAINDAGHVTKCRCSAI